MSERHPRKSGPSPSPLFLALLLVLVTLVVVGVVSLFLTGFNPRTPVQTGAMAKSSASDNDQNIKLVVIPDAAATDETPLEEETELPTLDIPTPTQPPDPTPYTPGPTAQFSTPIPTEEWLEYLDEQARFRIKYPPDWYLTTTPLEERVFGSTTQLFSYDPRDPNPVPKGTTPPENFIKLTIVSDSLEAMGWPFLPNETLEQWVQRTQPGSGDEQQILEAGETTLGGLPAYFQKTTFKGSEAITYFVQRDANMVYVGHFVPSRGSFGEQVIEAILSTLTFVE